jgi:hypothetical protein
MAYRILFRRDTAANWETNNPVLSAGEPGFTTDTNIFKIGDGVTAWSSIPEINPAGVTGPTGDVNFDNIASDVIASADATYNLGTQTYQWNNLYVAGSMYLGDSTVTISGSGTNFILAGGTGNQVTGNLEVSGDFTVNGTTNIRPYKVYSALVSQASSLDPTDSVLESTFNSTLTWNRDYTGRYTVSSSAEFTMDKLFVTFSQNAALATSSTPCHYNWQWYDSSTLYVESLNVAGATADNLFSATSVEIRVYN